MNFSACLRFSKLWSLKTLANRGSATKSRSKYAPNSVVRVGNRVPNDDVAVHDTRQVVRVVEVHAGPDRGGGLRLRHEDEPGEVLTGALDANVAEIDLMFLRMVIPARAAGRGRTQMADLPTNEHLVLLNEELANAILG